MITIAGFRERYYVVGLLAVVFGATVAALWPAVASLAGNWRDIHDYQHGYVIAPVALLWLFVVARLAHSRNARVSLVGCLLLATALFVWLVALRANSDIAIEILFPPILWLTILAVAGWSIARATIAPVSYLYFAIPVWEFLLPTLQWLSVTATETVLGLAGVPAEVSEYSVTLPSGTFEIIEGCSGKRYFIVALAVAVIAGTFQHLRGWRIAMLVAIGGLLALVANWIRIFVVIYAGYATEMRHYLVANEHATFGNAVFAALLLAIYFASRMFAPPAALRSGAAGTQGDRKQFWRVPFPGAAGSPFVLLGITAALAHAPAPAPDAASGARAPELGHLPVAASQWQGPLPALAAWAPRFAQPDSERRASYRRPDGRSVEIYLNLYSEQRAGQELVHYSNSLLAPGRWSRRWPSRAAALDVSGAPPLAMLEARGPSGHKWLLVYVYKIGAWTTIREPIAQAGYGLQSILRPVPAGVVSLSVQCAENCEEAQALVTVFWQEMSSSLLEMIPDHAR